MINGVLETLESKIIIIPEWPVITTFHIRVFAHSDGER
jgi:hypothetical protein